MDILVKDLIAIDNPQEFKIHFAVNNKVDEPLDVFVRDRQEWQGWNSHRGKRDVFNRRFIFSLIRYYHQPDKWLFGGVFEVMKRGHKGNVVRLLSVGEEYIGRLLVDYPGPGTRGRSFLLEKHLEDLRVSQLLERPFEGQEFIGYENVEIGFMQLEELVKQGKTDWKAALQTVKGVYLIVDREVGKMYVGSAYGDSGIWSRWAGYVSSGHGGNADLKRIILARGIEHARTNFFFSILEFRSMRTDDQAIIDREQYWKRVLQTSRFGYNKN